MTQVKTLISHHSLRKQTVINLMPRLIILVHIPHTPCTHHTNHHTTLTCHLTCSHHHHHLTGLHINNPLHGIPTIHYTDLLGTHHLPILHQVRHLQDILQLNHMHPHIVVPIISSHLLHQLFLDRPLHHRILSIQPLLHLTLQGRLRHLHILRTLHIRITCSQLNTRLLQTPLTLTVHIILHTNHQKTCR